MSYSEDEYLMISGLQHYYFCKRQWALIHIAQVWSDNALTAEGQLLHRNADDPFFTEKRKDVMISRSMAVSSASLGFSGILDVVEFRRDSEGASLSGCEGLWKPNIVEYKHGKPKKDRCDIMQLTAQVICLEEMLSCSIRTSDLFYAETNRRLTVEIDEELRNEMRNLAEELHGAFYSGKIQEAESHKNCCKCSLYEWCLPRLTLKKRSVERYIAGNIEGNDA